MVRSLARSLRWVLPLLPRLPLPLLLLLLQLRVQCCSLAAAESHFSTLDCVATRIHRIVAIIIFWWWRSAKATPSHACCLGLLLLLLLPLLLCCLPRTWCCAATLTGPQFASRIFCRWRCGGFCWSLRCVGIAWCRYLHLQRCVWALLRWLLLPRAAKHSLPIAHRGSCAFCMHGGSVAHEPTGRRHSRSHRLHSCRVCVLSSTRKYAVCQHKPVPLEEDAHPPPFLAPQPTRVRQNRRASRELTATTAHTRTCPPLGPVAIAHAATVRAFAPRTQAEA